MDDEFGTAWPKAFEFTQLRRRGAIQIQRRGRRRRTQKQRGGHESARQAKGTETHERLLKKDGHRRQGFQNALTGPRAARQFAVFGLA
ncbi:hypothetical protein D560_2495 [Bordetella holmesii ATCC 51541]|nr:hypothetical protein D560_2495 [Bordetella holmesii ATCC 51541]